MTCAQTTALGAYVLGALETGDRQETERHLAECGLCRDELVRLAPLPALLAQASLSDLAQPQAGPPAEVSVPPFTPTRPAARRWTRIAGTAAAVTALVVGVLVAGHVVVDDATPTTPATPVAATWSTSAGSGDIDAKAVLAERGWGTDIDLTMANLPLGQPCRLIVRSVDGRAETAGWWTTGYDSTAEVPASTSIDLADIRRLAVVRADGRVLAVLGPPVAEPNQPLFGLEAE